jgi:alpha-L-arabinofuranosidase
MRHSDKAEIACRSNMANSFCGAAFETNPWGVLKRPSFYVMQLYARHSRPVPLKIDQRPDGPDLFACASDDKKSVTIFAVNQKEEPVQFSFDSNGFVNPIHATAAEILCDTQNLGQPDVMNHWERPDRVKTIPATPQPRGLTLPPLSVSAIECQAE